MAARRRSRGRALFEPGFPAKSELQQDEKEAIAEAAAALVDPGTAIGISAGTTTYAIARAARGRARPDGRHQLGRASRTSSTTAAGADQTIILTGGVRTPSDALVGPFAVAALRTVNVDLVFMGVHGMDAQPGFTTPNMLEAETDRALVDAGRRLIVVADHTKWGVIGISSIARLDQADMLITDAAIDPEAARRCGRGCGELVVVGRGASRRRPTAPARLDGAGGSPRRRRPCPSCGTARPTRRVDPSGRARIGATTRSPTSGCSSPPAGPTGHGWAPGARAADRSADLRPRLLPVPRQHPGERRPEPGLRRHVRVHQRLRGPPARHARRPTCEYGLLRAEGERGTCRVLCFSPRHDLTLARIRRAAVRRIVDLWADQTTELGGATAGSRCSRTGARRWAPRTPIPTARSGPGRRSP